ncbi:hypothetical protein Ahy_A10g048581 [Arachis hypogaea]|uniref:Transposase MuDR plant domain-containing protein n=1 Tax=Arachis hypogaea TaxID=3818 RepID=A0A445B5F2_ARAHY|nr:hypothetical protein Ahy_A10g048581 [Arachis hypogaea]
MKSKPQFLPRRITRSHAAGSYRRSANKGKGALHVDLIVNDDSSDDDSLEDSSFKPIQEDSSSSEDNSSMSKPINKKVKDTKRAKYAAAKTKENIMQPDDALVEDVSDGDVDLGFVGTPGIVDVYEALDPGAESDGANSWHSEEMQTPPNSEDELQSDEESDEFPIFRNGTRFGELHLQVGMKFNTKVMCKVKECAWVVYASRDCNDSCWQIKTFNDDHTCARENTNRAANRSWVASKLVKKVRKYPNFKQCEAAVYFRTRCDLILNRNSIARALADARNVVYRDEKAKYAKLRDYAETLLKTNPGSTVQLCVEPQPNGDVIFDKMYVYLYGCKMGFKAGCRPLIGLDGAFLKIQFGGQILAAVAQDANHHIYVIAWTIVKIENTETWR